MRPAESYSGQLWQFTREVLLPAVPRLAWLVLGVMMFSGLNLLFLAELWPHFPQAETWFIVPLMAGLLLVPWLGAYTAQRVRPQVRQWGWRTLWQLATFGAYAVAGMSAGLLVLGLLVGLLNRL
ncbi:hypothetical protein [Hymenobacter rubripertinctus]|uniref:Uncharacterized protein n=1 Tax=Hymenobacter rubripertinctus TaxID=2029981 RepID=A0A418QU88_9BACT|nr:hypothetical protein [Hymenobacter rubripertinctus]RIY08806.1 hypothetical protein D0T11_13830 [Hymenobacter rubripertinctus]